MPTVFIRSRTGLSPRLFWNIRSGRLSDVRVGALIHILLEFAIDAILVVAHFAPPKKKAESQAGFPQNVVLGSKRQNIPSAAFKY